jgi:hypothetical protein
LAKPLVIFYLVLFIALPLALAVVGTCAGLGLFGSDGPPAIAFLIGLPVALYASYTYLRIPFEIQVENDTATFRSVLRKRAVPLVEISSIRANRFSVGFLDIKYRSGTFHLVNQMDGFHDFIFAVKSANPSVIVKGC